MSTLVERLTRLGGLATRSELLEVSTKRDLRRAVDEGLIRRPSRGRYVLPFAEEARALAHEMTGTVSLRSAALAHGWKVRSMPERPEITVPRGRKISAASANRASFRHSTLREDEVAGGVTVPLRTVIDCARALPLDEALSVADSALRSRLVTRAELRRAEDTVAGAGRTQVLRVLRNANGKAANPFESSLRAISLGVPGLHLVPQLGVRIADGVRVAPDLVDVDLGLVLEADSHEFHTKRQQLTSDCWRYDELVVAGWRVLRFTWEQVMFQQAWVTSVLVRAIGVAGRQTPEPPAKRVRRA